jgi:hypothetical protein
VCTHMACVRTALIKQISIGPRPKWSSGCCHGIASGALGVHSVLQVPVGSKYSMCRLECGFSGKRRHDRTRGRPLDESSILPSHR